LLATFIRHFNSIWLSAVAIFLLLLLIYPDLVTRDSIAGLLEGLGTGALIVYVLMCLTRSLLMIPCTPFILAGAITFPDMQIFILVISYIGIVVGAFLVYSFPSFGNYDQLLEYKYPDKIAMLREKMHGKYSFWIIAGWSFFPLVPTDVICYVAGMVKLSYKRMVIPLLIGEIPLVTTYVFLGSEIGEWFRI